MINYWYKQPFVYRSTDGGQYQYFSYDLDDWVGTLTVPYKELIHLPEGMAWDIINREMENKT